ncbi:MAG: phage BR0599 family protein [Acidobacteria bacterium]|nr:phage BR0599 family protein [Acidobacteriota bacterium]
MSYDSKEQSTSSGQPFELYLFQTQDKAWRLTSADEEKIYQGASYKPEVVSRTNTSANSEVKGGHIKVTLPKDHELTQLFISYIPDTPLTLVIFRGHEGEPESEMKVAFTGRVLLGRFTAGDTCELDCAPDTEILKRPIATACFQRQCNRVLFDPGCGLSGAFWKVSGTVLSISGDGLTVTIAACSGKEDGWFALGHIEKGYDRRMVLSHTGDTVVLINPLIGLSVGDTVNVYAGCDRSYGGDNGCVTKFDNGVNFMGWEWIPGRNPFAGGVG